MHPLSVCIYISISKIILKNVGPPGLKIFLKMSSVLYDCVLLRKLEDFLLFLSPLEFFENRKLKWVFLGQEPIFVIEKKNLGTRRS